MNSTTMIHRRRTAKTDFDSFVVQPISDLALAFWVHVVGGVIDLFWLIQGALKRLAWSTVILIELISIYAFGKFIVSFFTFSPNTTWWFALAMSTFIIGLVKPVSRCYETPPGNGHD